MLGQRLRADLHRGKVMTRILVQMDSETCHVQIQGHADFAVEEPDIVCSAVSILTYTLLQSLSNLDIPMTSHVENGFVEIYVPANEQVQGVISVIQTGFHLLESEYPKNIQIYGVSGEAGVSALSL